MSLRNKLILSILAVSLALSFLTVLIFLLTAYHHMQDTVARVYTDVARTFSFIQKAVAKNADDVILQLSNCEITKSNNYILLTDRRILIGRVEDCTFYGTDFLTVVRFTAQLNDLRWFIIYNRETIEHYSDKDPEFMDRFLRGRLLINDFILEGNYDPRMLSYVKDIMGYELVNRLSTLVMDFPIIAEGTLPIGRVVFIKDFSNILREVLFTPLFFLAYTLILVVLLSSVLFFLFNRIVRDIALLKRMTYRFKELDFSDIEQLSETLRKERTRDELYSLKRSILTMAQELEDTIGKLKMEKEKFEELAYTDPLTGLSNRRFFIEEAKRLVDLSRRYGEPLSLMMLDVDNFKRINDEYGHDVGDLVLKKLSEVIKKNIRSSDIAARFGGEEFVILLPKTDEEGASLVAERIRKDFRNSSVQVDGKEVWTSVSIGVAGLEEGEDLDTLIKKADEALYSAKRSGKDRVVIHRGEHQGKG